MKSLFLLEDADLDADPFLCSSVCVHGRSLARHPNGVWALNPHGRMLEKGVWPCSSVLSSSISGSS